MFKTKKIRKKQKGNIINMNRIKLLQTLSTLLLCSNFSLANAIILNEYNAVAPTEQLLNDGYDTYFGDIDGNGGNWVEFVITEDFLDLRGATLDIKRSDGIHLFTATFPKNTQLAYLRKGTILTVSEEPTDLSYNPTDANNPDWTININYNDLENIDGIFDISHRTMDISIRSVTGKTLLKNSGEVVVGWGVNDQEVFKLKKNPSADIEPDDEAYGDDNGKQIISTFGSPNQWIDDSNNIMHQDFTALRNITSSVHKIVILNEYNGVDENSTLRDGGYDSTLGRIVGNGGDWLELVVLEDRTDLRGAELKIVNQNQTFRAKFPAISQLSEVRSGTIVTISSSRPTDLSYDPFNHYNPDWNININIDDLNILEGNFDTNDRNMIVSMVSGSGGVKIMPDSGEGIAGGDVDSNEVFKLKENPSFEILPTSRTYGDDNNSQALSTFGEENIWKIGESIIKQDFTSLRTIAKKNNFYSQEASLVLNEYNGVASDKYLKDDGSDDYYGRVLGNGGSWIELIVTKNYTNLQNAIITIDENSTKVFSGRIPPLTQLAFLRKGTMITISNEPTDMSYSPFVYGSDDWKLNININDLLDKNGTFKINSNNIGISITDANGSRVLLSYSGEGAWSRSAVVDNQEVYKLKTEPNSTISPFNDNYGDDLDGKAISTFGEPNRWVENGVEKKQYLVLRKNKDLTEIGSIITSNIDSIDLRDGESLLYIPRNNSLWITDDSSHKVWEMDFTTHEIKSVITTEELGTFAPDVGVCGYEYHKGLCDIESIAYDEANDTLYIFGGKSSSTPAIFKLTRASINDKFTPVAYVKLDDDVEYPATIFVGNKHLVTQGKNIYEYDFEQNKIISDSLYRTPSGSIVGLAYSNNIMWITTSKFELLKVDWTTKELLGRYQMNDNGVYDPRGVEIIGDKLYILDGVNESGDEVTAPTGHVLKGAIHVYQAP